MSADAKQVFRRMNIGTAKELDLPVKQHLIDLKEPGERVTVAWYQEEAYQIIDHLIEKSIVPIMVGGSGLYAESVLSGYIFGQDQKSQAQQPRYQSLKMGISLDREVLRTRVAERTANWLEVGLLDEIKGLLAEGVSAKWLEACGQEYRYLTLHLLGELSLLEATEKTNISINQFIKRQYTWWRRHSDVHWVEDRKQALALVTDFLG